MPKPIAEMTLEELRAEANQAYAEYSAAKQAAEARAQEEMRSVVMPLGRRWTDLLTALEKRQFEDRVRAEVRKRTEQGACPV